MTARRIGLDVPVLPDPQRYAWIEANGINPANVPAAQDVLVEDGQITLVMFALDSEGRKYLTEDGDALEKVLCTFPLISPPEDHGL